MIWDRGSGQQWAWIPKVGWGAVVIAAVTAAASWWLWWQWWLWVVVSVMVTAVAAMTVVGPRESREGDVCRSVVRVRSTGADG